MKCNILISVLVTALAVLSGCESGKAAPASSRDLATLLSSARVPAIRSVSKWENKYGNGLEISTDHYRIKTTLNDMLTLRMMPAFLESAYAGYQKELPERIETVNKFDVYLFETRKQWEKFTEDFAGTHADLYKRIQKGAYCHKGACVAYYIGRNETYAAVGHEGWHQFCGRHFAYRLPSWLDEGIATLFETGAYKGNEWVFEPQTNMGRLAGMKKTLQTGNVIPVKQLVALNPGEVIGGMDDTVAFYSESYSLVRFLREEQFGKRLGPYQAMLLGGLRGTWDLPPEIQRVASDRNIPLTIQWNQYVGPLLFTRYITSDWDQVQGEYLTYCRKITYQIRLREPIAPEIEAPR
jgi:hypothetical protein